MKLVMLVELMNVVKQIKLAKLDNLMILIKLMKLVKLMKLMQLMQLMKLMKLMKLVSFYVEEELKRFKAAVTLAEESGGKKAIAFNKKKLEKFDTGCVVYQRVL